LTQDNVLVSDFRCHCSPLLSRELAQHARGREVKVKLKIGTILPLIISALVLMGLASAGLPPTALMPIGKKPRPSSGSIKFRGCC
jgi:hypothetical protein